MLASTRGTIRHPKFDVCVEQIAAEIPVARAVINGAVWAIERDPKGNGVHIAELDVWQARLILPDGGGELLLIYCVNRRFVHMLTIY
jgi:hypothetical protein